MSVSNLVGRRWAAFLNHTQSAHNLILRSTSTPYTTIRRDNGRRPSSTITPPAASTSQSRDDTSPNRSQGYRSPYRGLFYGTISILIGLSAGYTVRYALLPPTPHIPNTKEDKALLALLNRDMNALPIVKELRSHPDEWIESPAYANLSEEARVSKLTAGTMEGSRGLDVNTLFWNVKENRSISIIHFGGALAGWPGVTHGGAIATVLLENLERVASGLEPSHTEWTSAFAETMELQYRSPTFAQKFYVIRAEIDESAATDSGSGVRIVKATLESADKGKICVEATARCKTRIPAATVPGSSAGGTETTSIFHSWYSALQSFFT
ncbi:Thioesterase super member 4 [Trapelia coarctata]|nr:Thioesterase super member 4 [Trapelia coarctata]